MVLQADMASILTTRYLVRHLRKLPQSQAQAGVGAGSVPESSSDLHIPCASGEGD